MPVAEEVEAAELVVGEALVVGDGEEVGEVEVVGDEEVIWKPRVAARAMASLVPQHEVDVPQHQDPDVGVPSHGVIRMLPNISSACG